MTRVPYTFALNVPQGDSKSYRQELPEDGSIEEVVVFFPRGTRTDLQLTLVANGETLTSTDATDRSVAIPDYIVGSGTTYRFDVSMAVFEGQQIGLDADNVSETSDLDGFVSMTIDYDDAE